MPDTWLMLGVVVARRARWRASSRGFPASPSRIVAMSVWAWALPPQIAAPLAVFGALLGQMASLASVRGGFDLRRIAPLVVGGALGVPIGVFLLHNVDPAALQARDRHAADALRPLSAAGACAIRRASRRAASGLDAFVGLIGGVLGGLGGMSGSVPAIWTQLRGWKRDLRRATMQVYNIAMHVLTLTLYARTGTLDATCVAPVRPRRAGDADPVLFRRAALPPLQRKDVRRGWCWRCCWPPESRCSSAASGVWGKS